MNKIFLIILVLICYLTICLPLVSAAGSPATPEHKGSIVDGAGATVNLQQPTFVTVSGSYAYITSLESDNLEIVNISDPAYPVHVGSIVNGGSAKLDNPRGVSVSGNYAYVASYDSDALEIVNITDPANPVHESSIVNGGDTKLDGPVAVVVSGSYAYVSSYDSNALEIVDVSNPAIPVHAGSLVNGGDATLNGPTGVFVNGSYAYVTSSASNALEIVNVTDPANPVHEGSIVNGVANLVNPQNVFVSGSYAYVTSFFGDALEIVNVTDPANPVHEGSLAGIYAPRGVSVSGSYAYVTTSYPTITVVDVSNPASPVFTGSIGNGGYVKLDDPFFVTVSGTNAYVASRASNALEILDVSNPASPAHKSSIANGDGGAKILNPLDVSISGSYAYVSSRGSNALEIVDVADPANPVHKGSIVNLAGGANLDGPQFVQASGNYAYVTSYVGDALEIVDISNPATPVHKGKIENGGSANLDGPEDLFVSGSYAYVTSYDGDALEIVNITDPANPVHKGKIVNGGSALLDGPIGVKVLGNYAYVTSSNSNALEIVNVADPANPVHAGSIVNGNDGANLINPQLLCVSGSYAYVASYGSNALEIVNITDPANPKHAGSIVNGGSAALLYPMDVVVFGSYAYVTSRGSNALEIVDVSNPEGPVHVGSIVDGGDTKLINPFSVSISGPYAYVASYGSNALEIVDVGVASAPIVTSITPSTGLNNGPVTITSLSGSGFQDGAEVNLTRLGFDNISATSVIVAYPSRITCQFPINGAETGTWNVVVTNPDGQNGTLTDGFTVSAPVPVAGYTVNQTSGIAPLTVQFNDTSTGGTATSWNWSFGDTTWFNTTDPLLRNATKTYSSAGSFTARLFVSNAAGENSTEPGTTITVSDGAPVASFVADPTSGDKPLTVLFNDTSTGGTPASWNWSFGDGTWFNTTDPLLRNATKTYSGAGSYTARLFVSNVDGENSTEPGTIITVSSIPVPIASFTGSPTSGLAPLTVTYADSSTNSPTGWAWFFGDENYTTPWTQQNPSTSWSARRDMSTVAMPDGSIVLMGGGELGTSFNNDVYRSMDNGATWAEINASPGWLSRAGQSSVVMPDGSIILMGGCGNFESAIYYNDVWRSQDNGETWTEMNASASWSPRAWHSSVAMPDSSIVLMGCEGDVWRSIDYGATWTKINESAGWDGRTWHSSVVMPDGSIILMGGGYPGTNDIWRSTDSGATWTMVTEHAGWSDRYAHTSGLMPDGSIILMGGYSYTNGGFKNDIWRSTDSGTTWTDITSSIPIWGGRCDHSSVVMPDGSIVLMGGTYSESSGCYNDVWRFVPTGSSVQSPSHTYSAAGTYHVALQAYNAGGFNSTRKTGYITVSSPIVAPVANFTPNATSGLTPLTVLFNDTSTGGTPASWNWSFGNNVWFNTTDPLERNATYTYPAAGTFTARLTVSNTAGGNTTVPGTAITVTEPVVAPIANFTANQTSGMTPLTILFTDTSTGGTPATWNWSFGDGNWFNTTNPLEKDATYTYTSAGTFTARLTVSNSAGGNMTNPGTSIAVSSLTISGVTPNISNNTGSLPVTITGSNFATTATVSLANSSYSIPGTLTFQNNTIIQCTFPLAGAPTRTYQLVIRKTDGNSGIKENAFTVTNATPTITTVSPISAFNIGTQPVTITGTAFRSGVAISLVNRTTTIAGTITSRTTTQILCSFPLNGSPAGLYNLTVLNIDGLSTTKTNGFTISNQIPAITTVSPVSGYNTSSIPITISGTNFVTGCQVTLVNGSTTIPGSVSSFTTTKFTGTFGLTGYPAGIYNLTVTNPSGMNGTKQNAFTVLAPPTIPIITSFNPVSGVNTAALPFMINGSNFRSGATVTITNGTTNKTVAGTLTGTTKITCSLPLTGLVIGLYNLTVRNTDGSNVTQTNVFTVTNPTPTLTTITPVSGFNTSSIPVTISGTKFVTGCQVTLVNRSTTIPGSVSLFTATKFVGTFVLTGYPAGLYNLTVTNPGGPNATKLNAFTVTSPAIDPAITNFTPATGVNTAALPFTINGTNFRTGATVTITNGTTNKTVAGTLTGTTKITCSLPLTGLPIGVYNLTVRNTDGSNVTRPNAFTVTNPTPTLTTITPVSGFNTSSIPVTISGTKFVTGCQVTLVNRSTTIPGTVSAFTATKFVGTFVLTGYPAGLYNLTVTNPGGPNATKLNAFTVTSPATDPAITNFTPATGVNTAALPFTINGTNFRTGATVTITNGTTNKTVAGTLTGTTKITCSLPLTGLPIGIYNLTVRNTDGSNVTRTNVFTVTNPTPTLTTITPVSGYNTSSIPVTISGTKFVTGCQVTLVNRSTTIPGSISSFTGTKIVGTFVLTGYPAGLYNLTVTNPGGPNAIKLNAFTVTSPATDPSITSFNPVSGVNTASLLFTINGSNFRSGATVTIMNGTTSKTVAGTLTGTTKITCSLPLTGLPIGVYNLTVRNTDGSNVTRTNVFTVTNPTPTLTTITPVSGYNTSSVPVTISGTKFVTGCQVTLVNRSTMIPGSVSSFTGTKFVGTFVLTGYPAGIYNLTVTNPGNTNGTKLNAFTVLAPGSAPVISSINPASGFNNAHLPVTIVGSNFRTPTVYLNQGSLLKLAAATAGKVSTTTALYVTLPLKGVPGGMYNITIRNPDGVNTTAQEIFYVTDQAWISSAPGTAGRSPVVHNAGVPSAGNIPSGAGNPLSRQVVGGGGVVVPGIKGI